MRVQQKHHPASSCLLPPAVVMETTESMQWHCLDNYDAHWCSWFLFFFFLILWLALACWYEHPCPFFSRSAKYSARITQQDRTSHVLIQSRLPYSLIAACHCQCIETTCHLNLSFLIHILGWSEGIAPGTHTSASIAKVLSLQQQQLELITTRKASESIELHHNNSLQKLNPGDAEGLDMKKRQFTPWQRQIGRSQRE